MRKSIHTADIHLKASERMVEAAKNAATNRGMTLSEFARHALRRELEAA